MERLYVGTYEASISAPNGLTDAQRNELARSFLDVLQLTLSEGDLVVQFELQSTFAGCINLKASVVLKTLGKLAGATALAAYLILYPDVQDALNNKDKVYRCQLGEKTVYCKVLRCDIKIAPNAYETREGDTLDKVVKEIWKVPEAQQNEVARAVAETYPHALQDFRSGKLRPGKHIAQVSAAMCPKTSRSRRRRKIPFNWERGQ